MSSSDISSTFVGNNVTMSFFLRLRIVLRAMELSIDSCLTGKKNDGGVGVPGDRGEAGGSREVGSYMSSMKLTSVLSDMSGMKEVGVNVGEAEPKGSSIETSC